MLGHQRIVRAIFRSKSSEIWTMIFKESYLYRFNPQESPTFPVPPSNNVEGYNEDFDDTASVNIVLRGEGSKF